MTTFCTASFDIADDAAAMMEKRVRAYLAENGAKNVLFTKDSGDDDGSAARSKSDDDVLSSPRRR